MKNLLLLFLLLAISFGSCRKDEMKQCSGPNLGWLLHGYDTAQLGVFIVNEYAKGTGFTEQLSHTVSGTSFHRDSVYGPDTVAYEVNFYAHPFPQTFGGGLNAAYDHEYIFPLAGRTFRLRDIDMQLSKEKYNNESGEMAICAFRFYLNDTLYTRPVSIVSNKAQMATYINFDL